MQHAPQEWRRTHRCPVCPREFVSLAAKKQHVKNEHPRPAKP